MSASLAASSFEAGLALDVRAAAGGDREAFGRLVERSRNVVCAIALAVVRDVPASQDVAQDVFLAVWTRLPTLRDPTSFMPWLRQIARNRAKNWRRDRGRPAEPHTDDVADPAPGADAQLVDAEERRALMEALAALPDGTRELVTLYYREGRATRHLAELLGVTEEVVRQRLARARARLAADALERLGGTLARTAPSAAWAAAVVALAASAPTAAAAATLGGAGAKSLLAGGAGAGKAASLLAGSVALGIFGGLLGVVLGLRPYLAVATAEERPAVLAIGRRMAVVAVAAALGFALAGWTGSVVLALATHTVAMVFMFNLYLLRLPRAVASTRPNRFALVTCVLGGVAGFVTLLVVLSR